MAKVLEFNTADLSYPSQLIDNGRDQLIYKILGCSGIQDSTVPNLWVAGLRCHSSVDTGTASGTPSGVNAENVGVLPASGTNTYGGFSRLCNGRPKVLPAGAAMRTGIGSSTLHTNNRRQRSVT